LPEENVMQLIIHRGAHEVGGSCVELTFEDSTILLDVGLPLDSNFGDDPSAKAPQPLFQQLEIGNKKGRRRTAFSRSLRPLWFSWNIAG
jgi:predicted metal-dependent RNase